MKKICKISDVMYEIFLSKVRVLVNLDRENEEVIRNKIKKLGESPKFFGNYLKALICGA